MLPGFIEGAEGTASLLNVSPKIEGRESKLIYGAVSKWL